MAYQIQITPTKKQKNESKEPVLVTMAPFSSKSVVIFEDVPIAKTAKRVLRVENPSENEIKVLVTKCFKPDLNLSMEWTSKIIPPQNEVTMNLIWSPLKELSCKEIIQLTDDRNFKKDISVIFKSIKKPKMGVKRYPTISTMSTKMKSPKRKSSVSYQFQSKFKSQAGPLQTKKSYWNQQQPKIISPLSDRNRDYHYEENNFVLSKKITKKNIENISPVTPKNSSDIFDKITLTPVSEKRSSLDYLASLPTPINTEKSNNRQLRRLPSNYSPSEELFSCKEHRNSHNSTPHNSIPRIVVDTVDVNVDCLDASTKIIESIPFGHTFINEKPVFNYIDDDKNAKVKEEQNTFEIINRTFDEVELPHNESDSFLNDSLEKNKAVQSDLKPSMAVEVNFTSRLSMIAEEDNMHKTKSTLSKESYKLKRDIQLIGSPLKKYSESMRNLSTVKSPQLSLAIQGSMPNLNDMESLQSIEKNRYFQQPALDRTKNETTKLFNISGFTDTSTIFNQNEILAASSRFNVNENERILSSIEKQKPIFNRPFQKFIDSGDEKFNSNVKRRHDFDSPKHKSNLNLPNSNSSSLLYISPPKRTKVDASFDDKNAAGPLHVGTSFRSKKWGHVKPKKSKIHTTLSLVKKPVTPRKIKEQPRQFLYNPDMYLEPYINPDPFAATTVLDPFLASSMYLDEYCLNKYEMQFKKWLNALITSPLDFNPDCDKKIDVGKLFTEVRNKELILAPTKEEQSMNYLTKSRMESLRTAAIRLFMSEELRVPCSKIAMHIKKGELKIRSDRDLHLDIVMQRNILELLLCFNPLWLRIGLEVVFGEVIHLHSNSDIIGLSTFILNRLFKDKFLENKYSRAYTLSQEYSEHIKLFTLQKFLFLILFLDKAKTKRIIKHNPCLFVKKSPYKETKSILWRFSSELLASIGDITRELKRFGYVLNHKQSFIDEFDYAFKTLAVDLRDGIRLTRIAEIILLRDDLIAQVRSPAISRLQRIFNVDLALRALAENEFDLKGNILAGDIVDGHREKTLSLLWQIIYKFRAPKFIHAAKVIQKFWRTIWLKVYINRKIQQKIQMKREKAAIKIQSAFRSYAARKYTKIFKMERTDAAICLQKYCRRYLAQRKAIILISSVIMIQRWYRKTIEMRKKRARFLILKKSVLLLENWYKRILFARKLEKASEIIQKTMEDAKLRYEKAIIIQRALRSYCIHNKFQRIVKSVVNYNLTTKLEYRSASKIQSFFLQIQLRSKFLLQKQASIKIQNYWRSYKLMRIYRARFLGKREAIIAIQTFYRSYVMMKHQRKEFIELKTVTIKVQNRFRANRLCLEQRQSYMKIRTSTITIQRQYRAIMQMKVDRQKYLNLKKSAIILQNRFRAHQLMRLEMNKYQTLRSAAIVIQKYVKGYFKMKRERQHFQSLRLATIRIQQKFRANILCRKAFLEYIQLQYYTTMVQQRFRGNRLQEIERKKYLELKTNTIKIQQYFRAKTAMLKQREKFLSLRKSAIVIQQKYRAIQIGRKVRLEYLKLKSTTIFIQTLYRANMQMKTQRNSYQKTLNSIIFIQRHYRALLAMRKNYGEYLKLRTCTIMIQRLYRAKLAMIREKTNYQKLRNASILIQNHFRAKKQMVSAKTEYSLKRSSCIKIQKYFRSYLLMKIERKNYLQLKESAQKIQIWYRSVLAMRKARDNYRLVIKSTIIIQKNTLAYLQRSKYIKYRTATIKIQQQFRAYQRGLADRNNYLKLKESALIVQRRYRANKLMLKIRNQYLLIQSMTIYLQRRFRANQLMFTERKKFLKLKSTVVLIEQRYLANLYMKRDFEVYQQIRNSILGFQAVCRGYLARKDFTTNRMTPEMIELIKKKRAARLIQKTWRGYRVRKSSKNINIILIRERLRDLNGSHNKSNTVKFKITGFVKFLKGRFNVKEALSVLVKLENLSRTVPSLLMAHSTFISTFCYGIMAQAIRSEPDKQIIETCGRIILNLARFNLSNTFQQNGLVTVAHMLLRWCDKECGIFNTLCTLVYIFAQCPEMNKVIRSFMITSDAIFMLRETKKLLIRKEKMLLNRRNPRKLQAEQHQMYSLPHLKPDYGVIRGKPYIFNNSVYAFEIILKQLGINNIF